MANMSRFPSVAPVTEKRLHRKQDFRHEIQTDKVRQATYFNGFMAVVGRTSPAAKHLRAVIESTIESSGGNAARHIIEACVKTAILSSPAVAEMFRQYIEDPEHDEYSRQAMKKVLDQDGIVL